MEENVYESKLICRACLKIVEHTTQSFGYIEDATGNLRDMLMCCVPEMDIYVSPNPIICLSCIQGLILVHNFKSKCINTENIIRTYMQKYSLSDQNIINLGSVVRDVIEIKFNKQQEERRRQLLLEQGLTRNTPNSPPPLRFLDNSGQMEPGIPLSVTEFNKQQSAVDIVVPPALQPSSMLEPNSTEMNSNSQQTPLKSAPPQQSSPASVMNSTSQVGFSSHLESALQTNFSSHFGAAAQFNSVSQMSSTPPIKMTSPQIGPIPSTRPLPPLGYGPPIRYPPLMRTSQLESGPMIRPIQSMRSIPLRIINGYRQFQGPSSLIHNPNLQKHNVFLPVIKEFNDVNNIPSIDSKLTVAKQNTDTEIGTNGANKIEFHPIESKLRLVVRIPRAEIPLALLEKLGQFSDDNENSNSNGINYMEHLNEDELLQEEQELTNFQHDIQRQEELNNIDTCFNPENEDLSSNHITKIHNCNCMYLTTSEALFEEHKKKCKYAKISPKNALKCPYCPHITNRTYALNKHINTMHTKAVWFVCESCTYRSTDKSCLRRHVRKNHEQRTPTELFPCNICDMVISSLYNFNRHMLKHEDTIVTTYNCEFCSYTSKDRSNYRKHVFTHSPKQLKCPSCAYNNVSPYSLKAHIKKHHNSVGIEVADCKSDVPVFHLVEEIRALIYNEKQEASYSSDNIPLVDCIEENQDQVQYPEDQQAVIDQPPVDQYPEDQQAAIDHPPFDQYPEVHHSVFDQTPVDQYPEEHQAVIDQPPIDQYPEVHHSVFDQTPVDQYPEDQQAVIDQPPEDQQAVIDQYPEDQQAVIDQLPVDQTEIQQSFESSNNHAVALS